MDLKSHPEASKTVTMTIPPQVSGASVVLKSAPQLLVQIFVGIFFFSGFAALVYQVVWQRLLTLYYGVGTISTTLIVTIYMLGLGIGAFLGGYLAERIEKRISVYFLVELGIGAFGLISLPFVSFLGKTTAGSDYFHTMLYMILFLSFPTILMGITLPILVKIFNQIAHYFLHTISLLYFINTLGAAIGTLVASYGLISFLGLDGAVLVAAVINVMLAVLIFWIGRGIKRDEQPRRALPADESPIGESVSVLQAYALVFITGFLAIGYELIWFRAIEVLIKASPYAFSSTLSVYLLGIALGSWAMDQCLKKRMAIQTKDTFFLIQFLIALSVLLTFIGFYYLTQKTPFGFLTRASFAAELHPAFSVDRLNQKIFLKSIFTNIDIFFWPFFFVFVPTIFMGASFPLISSLTFNKIRKEGKTIGGVYFYTIMGNVMGGLVTGFFFLPFLGSEQTLCFFIMGGLLFGLRVRSFWNWVLPILPRITLVGILMLLTVFFFPGKKQFYSLIHQQTEAGFDSYIEEGVEGVVVTQVKGDKVFNYINGLGHGGRGPHTYGFYYLTVEALRHVKKLDHVFVLGYGTGSIAEMVLKSDETKQVTIVELNRTLVKNLRKIPLFQELLSDPRIRLIFEDGRRYLLRSHEKYDLVLMDPIRSTTAYSNNLYSEEFFKLVKSKMAPDGIIAIYIQEHHVMLKTIHKVFPFMYVYNYFVVASQNPMTRNDARMDEVMKQFPRSTSMAISQMGKYLGTEYLADKDARDYPINQDWKPYCEYYLGLMVREKLFGSGDKGNPFGKS